MQKKDFSSMLRFPLIVLGVAVIGLIIASFSDLSLAQKLYMGEKSIIKLAGYVTPLAGLLVISASAILLFLYYHHSRSKKKRNASFAALIIAALGGVFYGIASLSSSLSMVLAIVIGIVVGALFAGLIYFLLRKEDPHDFARIGYTYLLSSVFVFAFAYLMRVIIVRPNYSMLILTDEAETDYLSFFKDWFLFNTDKTGIPETVSSSYYSSFPTLSTALASLGLLLPLGCPIHKKMANKGQLFFWIAFALVILDGVMNILQGRAFLSDIAFALLIGCIPLFFVLAVTRDNHEVDAALASNKSASESIVRQAVRSPLVYGVGVRKFYEEQLPPVVRKKIRSKNNRKKSMSKKDEIFFKLNRKR